MVAELGLVDARLFRRAFDELMRRHTEASWVLVWPTLAVEAFLRKWAAGELVA
jgi:hypothetical protein